MPRPIRLAHLFSSSLGISACFPYAAPCLERGWELTAISPPGPEVDEAKKRGWRWLPLSFSRRMDPVGDAKASVSLYRKLRSEAFDIVHTHNTKPGYAGRVLAALARTPVIVHTIHGQVWSLDTPQPYLTAYSLLDWIASLRCDTVFTQSEEDRRTYLERKILPSERIVIIGNGVDLTRFDPARFDEARRAAVREGIGVGPDGVLFVAPGRLVREKGIGEVLEAAVTARATDARVVVAVCGDPDEARADSIPLETFERAKERGVKFLGFRGDMDALVAASDVVVLAPWPRGEGLPRVIIEAMVMGKPVIATDIRGCKELVRHGENGLLVPPRDAGALAGAFVQLARAPADRSRMGAGQIEAARRTHDIRAVVGRMIDTYDRLLAAKQLPR